VNNKKKKEITKALAKIIGQVSEAIGKAYGCYIKSETKVIIIMPARKKK